MAKILLVDDNKDVLFSISQVILKKTSHTVITAEDGHEAILQAKKEMPDLILLDINMPGMDGFETCRKLKGDPAMADIPIIFLTASLDDIKKKVRGLELGAEDFICQPIDNLEFLARIKVLLRQKEMTDYIKNQKEELEDQVRERTKEIRKSKDRLKHLIWNASEGIITLGLSGKVGIWNDEAASIFGFTYAETRDLAVENIIPELTVDSLEVLAKGKDNEWKKRRKTDGKKKDGAPLILEISLSFSQDAPDINEFILIVRDITAKMEMEERLYQTEKLATVGELVAGIGHELNNPLTGILLISESLLDGDIDENRKNMILTLQKEANRCSKVIDNLLCFAREEKKEKGKVYIHQAIDNSLNFLKHQFDSKGITIVTKYGSGNPQVFGNSHQLQQVIINILNNASQAIQESGVGNKVTMETSNRGNKMFLSITNNGPLIPEPKIGRLFDPFFSTKKTSGGTGLGLSISNGIIVEHGGSIVAKNLQDGSGVAFIIELSLYTEKEKGIGKERQSEAGSKISSKDILIVDDEPVVRDMLKRLLSGAGHNCVINKSGAEGLEALEKKDFDLVITDFLMPRMNGIEFYKKSVKSHENLRHKFIFISGAINDNIVRYTTKTGTYYLQKPFTKKEVMELIWRVCKGE